MANPNKVENKEKPAAELEVRGFLVTGCNVCPFVGGETGGYGDMEIMGYFCKLYRKEFENPDWDSKYMSGCRNEIPKAFPKFCRLKPVKDQCAKVTQKYKRVVDELRTIMRVVDDE